MSYDTEWLMESATVGEVCQHLEMLLVGLRAQGQVDRLPAEFRSISAKTADEVLKWCELLEQSSFAHGRLDPYFVLFDTARARISHLTEERPNVRMPYIVYVSREEKPDAEPGPRRFSTMDETAKACMSLREHGYKILRVRLPSGKYVTGSQIEWAIRIGVSSVKIALAR